MPPNDMSQEAILQMIADKAKADGDDFRLRIARRRTLGTLPEIVAMLEEAHAEHLVAPETWLPRLTGGGRLEISVYHSSNVNTPIGGPVIVTVDGDPIKPDAALLRLPDWAGPRRLTYPRPEKKKENEGFSMSSNAPANPMAPSFHHDEAKANAREVQFEQTLRDLNARIEATARLERDLLEKKSQMEVEAIRRDADARAREAEARVQRLEQAQLQPRAPTENLGSVVEKLMPLVLQVMESNRAASAAAAAAQAQATLEAAKMQAQVLQAIMSKPAIDPQMLALLTKDDGSARVMEQMGDLFSATTATTMNVLNAAVEMGLAGGQRGNEEPVALRAVREGVRALMALSGAGRNAAAGAKPRRQLPAKEQPKQEVASPPPAAPAPTVEKGGAAAEAPLKAAEPTALDKVIHRIEQKKDKPEEIATYLVENVTDPSIIEVFADPEVDFRAVFEERLGDWLDADENKNFLKAVIHSFAEQGVEAGLFTAEALPEIEKAMESLGT
ncbi:MAG: hypothetical protein WC729_29365 [Sphingomonas sp.]|jgi:hypothetical protein|uniref:hypothetical protein n=1 Tax=Sphingomonas sp. TaxID=28214 RepID=UPI003563F77E